MVSHLGSADQALPLCDIVCLNRYYGWYTEQGRIADGCDRLAAELDELHARHGKPIIVTEFGADTIPGCHAEPPEMFSEEYQAMFIERYLDVLERRPWVVGTHVWNLCDFKTAQAVQRPVGHELQGGLHPGPAPQAGGAPPAATVERGVVRERIPDLASHRR